MKILFLRESLKLHIISLTFVLLLIGFMFGVRHPAVVWILTVTRGLHHLGYSIIISDMALYILTKVGGVLFLLLFWNVNYFLVTDE